MITGKVGVGILLVADEILAGMVEFRCWIGNSLEGLGATEALLESWAEPIKEGAGLPAPTSSNGNFVGVICAEILILFTKFHFVSILFQDSFQVDVALN